jgi:hypothetical protein
VAGEVYRVLERVKNRLQRLRTIVLSALSILTVRGRRFAPSFKLRVASVVELMEEIPHRLGQLDLLRVARAEREAHRVALHHVDALRIHSCLDVADDRNEEADLAV